MNKTITIFCESGIAYEHVERHMQEIPNEYKESCVFIVQDDMFAIQYSRPETTEEADRRFMFDRFCKAKEIINEKIANGESIPDFLKWAVHKEYEPMP